MTYITLLRGINVGGNNKVTMSELKACFEQLGFTDIITYINSGNILFIAPEQSTAALLQRCEAAIEATTFGFRVICTVIAATELADALAHAPSWWGANTDDKYSALFVIPPATPETIMQTIGALKPEYEQVATYGSVIFWTASTQAYSRTRFSKIVGTNAYKSVTIRNANTTKKLVELAA